MIGERIKIVMELLKLSRDQVAKDMEVDRSMVSNYRSNKNEPSYAALARFCKAYHVNVEFMVTGEGEVFKQKEIEREKEATKILRAVAIIKVEKRITQKAIEESIGLRPGYFTDLKKGTISMPYEKVRKLEQTYRVSV